MYSSEAEDEFTVTRGLARREAPPLFSAGLLNEFGRRQLGAHDSGQALERWTGCGGHRCGGLALAGDGHGILVLAIDAELKMQVRASRPARGAYGADVVALCYRLPFFTLMRLRWA